MVDLKNAGPLKYIRCDNEQCGKYSFEQDLEKNDYKCPSCGKRISKPERRFKSDLSLEETNVPSNVFKSKEKLVDLFDFLISQEREITIQIEGNKTSYTSRIIKAVYGDVLSKVGKDDELVIEKLTPDTGNALLKLSPRLVIQFPLSDQTLKFDTNYLGESTNYPHIGLIVRFPDSVRIEERGIYDQNTLIFSETGEEEEMNKPGGSHRIGSRSSDNICLPPHLT
jgi:DNA-directed RNA polymerase subunit RPC12/RpoP